MTQQYFLVHDLFYHVGGKNYTTTTTCDEGQFKCKAGFCQWVDEEEAECTGPCIPNRWVGDGQEDCSDGSDESKCILHLVQVFNTGPNVSHCNIFCR